MPPRTLTTLALALLGSLTAEAAPPPRGPLVPKDPAAQPCTHPTNKLGGQVQLKQSCIYGQSFVIHSSNSTLDCNGAQIVPPDGKPGVKVWGEIDSVLVKNCYVSGGIGIAVAPPTRLDGESHEDYRKRSPTNIVVANVQVTKSSNVGVYVHHHVVGATVKDSIIEDNDRPGIYLGAESRGNLIRNNLIRDNGHRSDGKPSIGWYRREGIAVDASAQNVIEDNQLEGNAFGGILLYKNCWEHAAAKPDSWQRIQHSHSNVIRNNSFADMEYGVWVAARQARDLTFMECGDPTPYNNPIWISSVFTTSYPVFKGTYPAFYLPLVSIWPDFAESNTIEGNTFQRLSKAGIRIEDDQTKVTDNLFIGDFEYIYLGSPFRANLLGQPVDSTSITDNSFASPASQAFAKQLALVPGEHSNTTLAGNLRACYLSPGKFIRSGAQVTLDKPAPQQPGSTVALLFSCQDGVLQCIDPACATADAGPPADSRPPDQSVSPPDAGASDTEADAAPGEPPRSSGGCSMAPVPDEGSWTLLLAGLLLLRTRRRR